MFPTPSNFPDANTRDQAPVWSEKTLNSRQKRKMDQGQRLQPPTSMSSCPLTGPRRQAKAQLSPALKHGKPQPCTELLLLSPAPLAMPLCCPESLSSPGKGV